MTRASLTLATLIHVRARTRPMRQAMTTMTRPMVIITVVPLKRSISESSCYVLVYAGLRVHSNLKRASDAHLRNVTIGHAPFGEQSQLSRHRQVMDSLACLCISGIRHLLTTVDSHRSEEHTSELQSRFDLVCRLLLEK